MAILLSLLHWYFRLSAPSVAAMGFRALCHWGPLIALSIVKIVTWMTLHCLGMWWPPWTTTGSSINASIFLFFAGFTLYFFLSALTTGPGYVPLKWEPDNLADCKYLQYCAVCEGYKPPRSHHCRKCGRCIKKMDHHCPWINGCVGWANHLDFTMFLFFAVLGCGHAAGILLASVYRGIHRTWYYYYGNGTEPIVDFTMTTLCTTILALGLAIGVVLAVGMLFYFQLKSILRNRTAIEEWIEEKANYRLRDDETQKYLFPYDLGLKKNFLEVFTFNPPLGDGINWEVREGCHQYSLTIEQLNQKLEKRVRSRLYEIRRDVRGGWCQISAGCCTVFRPPFTDEARIPLILGDKIIVTRWKKYWLFGEKIEPSSISLSKYRIRGWFPRNAAVEVVGDVNRDERNSDDEQTSDEEKKDQ